ncbi:Abi family protein [Acinetobacter pseudolwoffii]|uniref:Abi family protein n=1 Tax=Acinetobacter pseudolwoffii TaxID=2053287 RepID=UPI0021E3A49F|nr:Abi family protein [Acinetobacter pseudolwoffii]
MKSFNKPAKTFTEQIELLNARGMQFANEQDAQFYLEQINYYRLGAYWLPFEHTHSPHCFKPDTSFEQVLELYVFDRELRLLILDAIERLEVAVRTRFAYELAHRHGCHAYLQGQYFKPAFRWQSLLESLKTEVSRADEVFIEHYKRTYDDPELPPIWATCEVMSFGQLSKWYQLLAPIQTRKAISSHFDCDEKQFEGLLQHFVYLRNTCAHHSRLWNRKFTKTIAKPRSKPMGLRVQCNFEPSNSADRKIYNSLVFLLYFMDKIAPQHTWRKRLVDLLLTHHNISKIAMGFPEDWQSHPIWQIEQ